MLNLLYLERRTTNTHEGIHPGISPFSEIGDFRVRMPQAVSDTPKQGADYARSVVRIQQQQAEWEFEALATQLIQGTRLKSSSASVKSHPAYKALVSMGKPAASKIIERLSSGDVRVQWFPILKSITGVDPVQPHNRGIVSEMAREWVAWAANGQAVV